MQASVPLLAHRQAHKIAGINNMIHSISTIASPALAALLISLFELQWILLIDVAGAIIAVATLLMVHIPTRRERRSSSRTLEGYCTRD
jgi:DHA3 family macrolide efflux protein-like MFS transporter